MAASTQLRTAILITACLVGRPSDTPHPALASEQANQVTTEKLTELMPAEQFISYDATLAFLSDDTLVLQLCHSFPASNCPLLVIQIYDGRLHILARRDASAGPALLFRAEDEGILAISQASRSSQLFSTELSPKHQFPYAPSHLSLSGKTAAAYVPDNQWTVFRTGTSLDRVKEVRRVAGELEAVSDNAVAIRDRDTIRVETLQGKLLSTFKVKAKCPTELQIVSQGRLFLQSCGPDRIVDLHGKEITRFRPPGGWGLRRGWSADGTRLLYDRYVRTVPTVQRFGEVFIAIATLGIGVVDESANGEAVRVVDTTTGKTCFEWKDPKQLIQTGIYHADISPSGRLVALVTGGTLSVYRLPQECSAFHLINANNRRS